MAVSPEFLREKRDTSGVWPMFGVDIRAAFPFEAIDLLDRRTSDGFRSAVAFANANLLNLAFADDALRLALQNFIVFNDGIGVEIGARILHGVRFPANLNGTDFVPAFLETTSHSHRIFMVGARSKSVSRAAANVAARYRKHAIVGWSDGYGGIEDSAALVERMRRLEVSLVLVALGNPKQEMWLAEWLEKSGATLGFAVGSLFDFWSGLAPRAPSLVRQARCEWIYRLAQEPRRLAHRYLVGNPVFLARIASRKTDGWRGGDERGL